MNTILLAILTIFATSLVTVTSGAALGPNVLLTSALKSYTSALAGHPVAINMITASALSVLSDSISQAIERRGKFTASSTEQIQVIETDTVKSTINVISSKRPKHSIYRSFCMSVYGALISGYLVILWIKFLNHIIPQRNPSKVLLKVFVNQFFMSPTLNSLFFSYVIFTRDLTSTIDQKLEVLRRKISVDLVPTIKRSCVYWGIMQFLNFTYVPYEYQVLYSNGAFLLWTIYLSIVGYRKV